MSERHSPEQSETSPTEARRSKRIHIAIPVIIAGTDASGRPFQEGTRTIVVNKHGGKISTFHQLALGSEITVENRRLGRTARASVVWLGERRSPKEPTQIGIQLFEAQNIWGLDFIPEDWKETDPSQVKLKPAEATTITHEAAEVLSRGAEEASVGVAGPSISDPSSTSLLAGSSANANDSGRQAGLEAIEDRLRALTARLVREAEAGVQRAAKAVEDRLAGSVEAQVQPLLAKFEEVRQQVSSLLTQVDQGRQVASEQNEKAQAEFAVARARLLENLEQEAKGKISRVFNQASAEALDRAEADLQQLTNSAQANWSREIAARLDQMTEACLHEAIPTLVDRAAEALKEVENRLRSNSEALSTEWRSAFEKDMERLSTLTQAELEKRLRESAERIRTELALSLEGRAKTVQGEVEASFQAPAQKLREQMHAEIDNADLQVRKYCEQEVERAERIAAEHIASRVAKARESFDQVADQLRAKAQQITEQVLENFRTQAFAVSQALLDGLKEQLSGMMKASLHHFEAECDETASNQLVAAREELLGAARASLMESLKAAQESSVTEARKYLAALSRTTVETLNREASAGLDRYRSELGRMAGEDLAAMVEQLKEFRSKAEDKARLSDRKGDA